MSAANPNCANATAKHGRYSSNFVRPSVRHNSIFSKTADVSSSANPTLEYTMAVNTGKMATGSIDDVEEFQCNGKDSK